MAPTPRPPAGAGLQPEPQLPENHALYALRSSPARPDKEQHDRCLYQACAWQVRSGSRVPLTWHARHIEQPIIYGIMSHSSCMSAWMLASGYL